MKILSKEKFEIELNKIVSYGVNDIAISKEDIQLAEKGNFFVSECLDGDIEDNSILLSIEDINEITDNKDLLVMSSADFNGANAMNEAINLCLYDFERNNLSLKEIDGVLIYFQINSNYEIMDISEAMGIVYDRCSSYNYIEEPDIIFGVSCDKCFEDRYVKATIFMSYSKKQTYSNNYISRYF